MTGPDEEVVGVAKNDLRTQLQQIFRRDRFDRGQRPDRHEYRRVEGSVQRGDLAAAGRALGRLMEQGEGRVRRHY